MRELIRQINSVKMYNNLKDLTNRNGVFGNKLVPCKEDYAPYRAECSSIISSFISRPQSACNASIYTLSRNDHSLVKQHKTMSLMNKDLNKSTLNVN